MKEQVWDLLLQGADLDAQGYMAKAAAREFLKDACHKLLAQGGYELVEFALPMARRLVGDPAWVDKLNLTDFTTYCVSKLPGYPTGVVQVQPGQDPQAEYLSKCSDEYMARW